MPSFTRKNPKGSTATGPEYVFAAILLQNCNKGKTAPNYHYVKGYAASYPHKNA